ncbi:hypothetical protein EUS_07810 [[Eubacterium] siraeum 70/3]|uniref:Uncharacterized protein n=1 Tax=[Eubacterium] siraeum 70/3 TaxID=657319 RepID=D4JSF8_9FIRM|nr:hypothetical protein EUS_07810 [[Eubacterium] siraeum 70/3]
MKIFNVFASEAIRLFLLPFVLFLLLLNDIAPGVFGETNIRLP